MQTKSFLIASFATIFFAGCAQNKADNKKAAISVIDTRYQLVKVQEANLHQTLKLPAQLAAYQEVSIFPKVNGYVKSVLVDIGSHVSKGQLLMTLEAPEIQQQAIQAKEKFERSKSDFYLDKENYARLLAASKTRGAISPMDLSATKAKMESDSTLSNSEKASWQMQEAMLAYLNVSAPFNGTITERNTHPGALVSAESKDNRPMLELKQVDHLRLQVDIPEGVAASLKNNDEVSFSLSAFPGKKMTAKVSRKSGNVNIQYRSERVELDVPNSNGLLSPGMYADVLISSQGNGNALVVPKSAVITSTERMYVLVVRNGKTVKVDVTKGYETSSETEITGDLRPNETVIANATEDTGEGIVVK
jgi:membrane fusion protein (multidrug efflux system)